jgi:two-component system, response regulator PdtaR
MLVYDLQTTHLFRLEPNLTMTCCAGMMDRQSPAPLVLVVEDEPLIRTLVVDVLAEKGLDVSEASTADEALAVMTLRPEVKVLFSDINMPGELSGLDLAREVHHRWPKVQLMLTSGRARTLKEDLPDAGVFISKPYDIEAIAERIYRLTLA